MTKAPEIPSSSILFLNNIIQKVHGLTGHIDTQTNMIVAISSAIFIFSSSKIYVDGSKAHPYLIALSVMSAASVITALFAIHPPKFMRKKGQSESLMYHKKISSYKSYQEYAAMLEKVLKDEDSVVNEYAQEIYNISKYYYRPKRQLFKIARNFLLIGFVISFLLLLMDL